MDAPVVRTRAGAVQGTRVAGGFAYLGIPYAEPAVGADRFASPRPRAPWDGTRDATAHGPTSLQADYPAPMDRLLAGAVDPGDDYLNVAVWTPDPGAAGLPVIVWIHGGAFVRGANRIPTYDGAAFARDGVVLVGVNYRLGVPGFGVVDGAPANLGLRDQLCALQWVRDEIAAFGGDPARVTIMGESAGGMSVATLMAMPAARGLFARAVIQSGGGVSAGPPQDLRTVSARVAELLDVPATAQALGGVDPDRLLQAQNQAALELTSDPSPARWGAGTIAGGFGIMPTFPVIDGDLLTDLPEALLAAGASSDVPLLIGATSQEFNLWGIGAGLARSVTDENLPRLLAGYGVPAAVVDGYRARRPQADAGQVYADVVTDLLFRQPSVRIAQQRTGAATYVYEFDWRTPQHGLGACHTLELPFVFDTLDAAEAITGAQAPQALADQMHAAWVRFATEGDPGWVAYDTDRRAVRVAVTNA